MGDKDEEHALAADFLEWQDEGVSEDPPPWADYIRLETGEIAVWQLERLAEARERARVQPWFWIDAVRSAHLALTAAMVEALEGSSGVGAMTKAAAKATLEYFDADRTAGGHTPWPAERTMPFLGLLAAIQLPHRLEFSQPLRIEAEQLSELRELNDLREKIDHPKFTRWGVPIEAFDSSTRAAADLFRRVIACVPHRFGGDLSGRVTRALELCRELR